MDWGKEAERRLAEIAALSEPGPGVTRLPFTPEHAAARAMIGGWMAAAGMEAGLDAACTVVGRREGPEGAPTLLIGSHQDTVKRGGAFDGIMGVVVACLAVEKLRADGLSPPVAVEVLAFADEEGVRFPTALLGPRALAGTLDPGVLDMRDGAGVMLRDALDAAGGDACAVTGIARDPAAIAGYLEVHIEQGPVLEAGGHALGVVTGICGIERSALTVTGVTGHAGTVPMGLRADALVTAAAIVTEVDRAARTTEGVRATVGRIENAPNVVNAIPDEVRMTIEVRSEDDAAREAFSRGIRAFCAGQARARGTAVTLEKTYEQPAVACDPEMMRALEAASQAVGAAAPRLPSGATHDASAMAGLCPVGMLFVRCRGGISHSPAEHASAADMGRAVAVLAHAIARFGG